jgi:hypothetical protein
MRNTNDDAAAVQDAGELLFGREEVVDLLQLCERS